MSLSLIPKSFLRSYRPSVSPSHQEKILSIRSELAALGIATGRSRARRNGMSSGTAGVEMKEAIEKLREFDLKSITEINAANANADANVKGEDDKTVTFGHNSLILNAQVKLLKEQ